MESWVLTRVRRRASGVSMGRGRSTPRRGSRRVHRIHTAAATAPVPPASSTALELGAEAATPKTRPKIETVPSSMPKTMDPTEAKKERRIRPASVAG